MYPVQQTSKLSTFLQRTLFVLLALITVSMLLLAFDKFSRSYKVNIIPRADKSVHKVNFARTPVLNIGKTRLSVMAISYHPEPRRRLVILRDLTSNKLTTLRAGEASNLGVKVLAIDKSTVSLGYEAHTIVMSINHP